MKKQLAIVVVTTLIVLMALAGAPVSAADSEFEEFPSTYIDSSSGADQIIVKFKPWVSDTAASTISGYLGSSVVYTSQRGNYQCLNIPENRSPGEMVELYSQRADVEYAELNTLCYAFWQPNDPYYSYQWHMDNAEYGGINCEDAWDLNYSTPGQGTIVAVLDTGVAYESYTESRMIQYPYYLTLNNKDRRISQQV